MRRAEIEQVLSASKSQMEFHTCVADTRSHKNLAKLFGMQLHPLIVETQQARGKWHSPFTTILGSIFYCMDIHTQYTDAKASRKRNADAKLQRAKAAVKERKRHQAEDRQGPVEKDSVVAHAAGECFRSKAGIGTIFALPAGFSVRSMVGELQPSLARASAKKCAVGLAEQLEADCEVSDVLAPAPKFFRLLHATPGSAKTIPVAFASADKLRKDAVLATLHVGSGDPETGEWSVDVAPVSGKGVESVVVLSLRDIGACRDLTCFEKGKRLQYTIEDCPSVRHAQVITDIVRAGAYPNAEALFHSGDPDAIAVLVDLAERGWRGGAYEWQLGCEMAEMGFKGAKVA